MKNKKIINSIIIIFLISILLNILMFNQTVVFADNDKKSSKSSSSTGDAQSLWDEISDGVKKFDKTGSDKASDMDMDDSILNVVFNIATIIYTIAIVIVVGGTFYLAIKYSTSGPNDKAKVKSQLVGFIITSVILIAAIPIWRLIVGLFSGSD